MDWTVELEVGPLQPSLMDILTGGPEWSRDVTPIYYRLIKELS